MKSLGDGGFLGNLLGGFLGVLLSSSLLDTLGSGLLGNSLGWG